jgi:phage-related protein
VASKAELELLLSLTDDVSKAAKDIKGDLESVGKSGASAKTVIDDLGKVGKTVLAAGLAVGTAAVVALGGALYSCVNEAIGFEKITAQTEAVVKSTGGAAGLTAEEIVAMADALEGATGIGDDAILGGQNLLLTFTNIGKDVFPMATQAMLDMSVAMGTDASAQAVQLGKALNNPTAGLTALTRVGITFTDEQKNLIKSLQESGDMAGAQTIILQELQKEFGGSAEAAGNTFAGQMAKLQNTFGDVKKEIGEQFLPILLQLATALSEWLAKPEIQAAIASLVAGIGQFATKVGEVVSLLLQGDIAGALTAAFGPEIATKIIEITTAISGFVQQIVTFVTEHSEAFKGALIAIGAVLAAATIASAIMGIGTAIATLASPVGLIIGAVALLGAAWAGNWGGIQEKTQAVIDFVKPYIEAALAAIQKFWTDHGAAIIASVQAAWDWIQAAIKAVIDFISPLIQGALEAIKGWWAAHGESVMAAVSTIWETIKTVISTVIDVISKVISTALEWIQAFWTAHGETIMAVVQNMWDIIKAIFETVIAVITEIFNFWVAVFTGDWEAAGEAVRGIVDTLWNGIKTIFSEAVDNLKLIVSDLVTSIVGFFTSIDWAATGKAIIDGIKNGVTNAASALGEAAKNAAQAALDAVKGFLGINSPSSVTAKLIGKPFVEGIGAGIDAAMGKLTGVTLPDMAMNLVGGAAGHVATQTAVHNTYNLHINTSAPAEPIIADFGILAAMGA